MVWLLFQAKLGIMADQRVHSSKEICSSSAKFMKICIVNIISSRSSFSVF